MRELANSRIVNDHENACDKSSRQSDPRIARFQTFGVEVKGKTAQQRTEQQKVDPEFLLPKQEVVGDNSDE